MPLYGTMEAMTRRDDERSRVLFYVGVGAGVLLVVTVVFQVLLATIAPLFGLAAGTPDPAIVGSMLVWAATSFGLIPAAAFLAWRNRDKGEGE